MAQNYKFPGVYPEIKDLSQVVSANNVAACAYVGQAEYGPVLKPTLLSSLQDYTDIFGSLSSQYGYAGYSLAVASETISTHYFVRVVPTGDGVKDAKYSGAKLFVKGVIGDNSLKEGYTHTQITDAEKQRDNGLDSGLIDSDDVAFVVTATDPNNRHFYVTVSDSTINDNPSYIINSVQLIPSNDESGEGTTLVTVSINSDLDEATVGDLILVSRMDIEALNGTYEIKSIEKDETTGEYLVSYEVDKIVEGEVTLGKARVGRFPDGKDTTFTVSVLEKVGKSFVTLETFLYCTLFPSKDAYGNSMFVEDVINGSSDYIQVFANKKLTSLEDAYQPAFVEKVELTGGQSGSWETSEDMYRDLCKAWELFRDRSQVAVSLLMNSGYVSKSNASYQNKMLEIAEARRDCFCLFDCPMTEVETEDLIDWRSSVQYSPSYRACVCSPWVKTYDSVQGRANFVMCPSAYMARIMGERDTWVAPAGLNRGVLESSTVSPTGLTKYYNTTEGGILYTDNQINCMIREPGAGFVCWGQRTLQKKPSAMDRINVARTVIYIETVLRDAAKWHLFENNTPYERTQITLQFSSFLNQVLSANGIQRFTIVCDSSNNTPAVIAANQLVIDINLWPTYCQEVIKINTIVQGADVATTLTTA